jgi:hypothetical protein
MLHESRERRRTVIADNSKPNKGQTTVSFNRDIMGCNSPIP